MADKPPVDQRRWILVKHKLSRKKALACRRSEIQCLLDEREEINRQMIQLGNLKTHPLPTHTEEYVPVLSGDKRYATAETLFDPRLYTGTWTFNP